MSEAEWEKVLWKHQDFPDNYIPPNAFLSALRKNPNFTPFSYWPLVGLSFAVTQHITTIFIFLTVFIRLRLNLLDPRIVVWISVTLFLVGYIIWEFLDVTTNQVDKRANRAKTLKSSILIFLVLVSLSPVLRTLTAATSSDSIWALSAFLFMLSALLADYSPAEVRGGQARERLTSVLSINAAISSSVVLASRLSDDLSVFALILFAVHAFALFPSLRHRLQGAPIIVQALMTLILGIMSIALATSLSLLVTWLFSAVIVAITFLAPATLVWAQKYKNEIRGPWDVAVPKVN